MNPTADSRGNRRTPADGGRQGFVMKVWLIGGGSGVLRLDRFEADDDSSVVAEDALFDAVGVLEITSLDVELSLESGSTAHDFTGTGETDDRDDRLRDAVHAQITGHVPDGLSETLAFGALERHLSEFLRIEEVGALEVLVELFVATIHAVDIDVDVEGEVVLHARSEGHDAIDIVEPTPELSRLGVLHPKKGGAVNRVDVVGTGRHVRKRFHDGDRTGCDGGRGGRCRGVVAESIAGAEVEASHGGGAAKGDGGADGTKLDGQAEEGHGWSPFKSS